MSAQDHERWRENLAPYLLGALEPGEGAGLDRHLAGCEECRAELDRLRPAAQLLPEAVERVEPPPELRRRIVADIRGEVASSQSGRGRSRSFADLWRRFVGGASSLRALAAGIAAVVLIVVGGAVAYGLRDSGEAGEATTVTAGEAPGVTAKLVRKGDSGTLRLANLRQLPPDEVLQAWIRRERRVQSADVLFVPNRKGAATAVIDDLRDVDAVMVTVEPHGGSEFPTTEPLVAVSVPQ